MPRVATIVPAETDILCEGCGYTLNGLPESGNCPECGQPIDHSLGASRTLSEFESQSSLRTFLRTSTAVLLRPVRFYRNLATRVQTPQAASFARRHREIASVLFFLAAAGHFLWILKSPIAVLLKTTVIEWIMRPPLWFVVGALIVGSALTYLLLYGISALAAWLSALEARYWGMRLPRDIVRRGLQFHCACYVPVAILAATIVWGYRWLLEMRIASLASATVYLYTLCAAVIVSAIYLFVMYWIAMKNMMYANR